MSGVRLWDEIPFEPRADNEIIADISSLVELHRDGALGGSEMPEDVLADIVPKNRLADVLTLGMCLNYQRNSYGLWQSIAASYRTSADRWVFDPALVPAHTEQQLRDILVPTKIALQPNRHVSNWRRVAEGLAALGGTTAMIEKSGNSVAQLREIVCVEYKSDFPYLSGPKIFNYWTFVLEQYCDVRWIDRNEISVAPDTHVLQATERLGLMSQSSGVSDTAFRLAVATRWRELLLTSKWQPIDVHTPLWLWSRGGFEDISTLEESSRRTRSGNDISNP